MLAVEAVAFAEEQPGLAVLVAEAMGRIQEQRKAGQQTPEVGAGALTEQPGLAVQALSSFQFQLGLQWCSLAVLLSPARQ